MDKALTSVKKLSIALVLLIPEDHCTTAHPIHVFRCRQQSKDTECLLVHDHALSLLFGTGGWRIVSVAVNVVFVSWVTVPAETPYVLSKL